ncbi:MAG: hypothetical protein IT373_17085 [Polyangiaceae bacterium]|nr:hypothetical protein [Polyangiaceae bacterium]
MSERSRAHLAAAVALTSLAAAAFSGSASADEPTTLPRLELRDGPWVPRLALGRAAPGQAPAPPRTGVATLALGTDDPFSGDDKAQHFGLGFALGSLGYGLARLALDDIASAAGVSAGLVLGLGALKEGVDAAGLGTPSWKDWLWGAVGGSLGLGLAVTFDAALR